MDGRAIPGFFFDEGRQKYFRVQERKDVASKTEYSRESVRRKKTDAKKRKIEYHRQTLQETQRIRRSRLIASNVCPCASLRSEIGFLHSRSLRQDSRAKAFTASLGIASFTPYRRRSQSIHRTAIAYSVPLCLQYDQQLESVFTGRISPSGTMDCSIEVQPLDHFPSKLRESYPPGHDANTFLSNVASMSFSRSRRLAVTTLGFDGPAELRVFQVGTMFDEGIGSDTPHLWRETSLEFENPLFCSAANPFSMESDLTAAFAIGEGRSARVIHLDGIRTGFHARLPADVLSLAWKSRNVLAVGGRDKSLRLWDTRGSQHHFITSRLEREGPISTIYPVGDSYIALQGEPGCPALYDLRMASVTRSKPVVTYPTSSREDHNKGFDVHERLGLVVHGQYDGTISLNSLWTGEQTRVIKQDRSGTTQFLKFVDSANGTCILGCHASIEFKVSI